MKKPSKGKYKLHVFAAYPGFISSGFSEQFSVCEVVCIVILEFKVAFLAVPNHDNLGN